MKKAFTLAEVLITLMIIGIVAALTIPSVISNYQQQEFKTGLKKAVSVLNEAIQTNIAQEGETPYENEDLFSYLQRHINVLKSERRGASYDHDKNIAVMQNSAFYTTDGMRFEFPITDSHALINPEKIIFYETGVTMQEFKEMENGGTNSGQTHCGSYGLEKNLNKTIYTPCIVLVDVNGDKKPSVYASNLITDAYKFPTIDDKKITDIFLILITDEKAVPYGVVAQRAMYSK